MKDLVGSLIFSSNFVKPFMGYVTVGTRSANSRPVLEVYCLLELLIYVIPHLVAGNAECLSIRHLQCPVEAAPEQNATNTAGNEQRRERKNANWDASEMSIYAR